MQRHIIHVDMDAFYASIEMRDHPEWRDKALAVGPDPRKNFGHGVVTTANYKARAYGVHSALASKVALQRCPDLIFCPVRKDYYQEVSAEVQQIFYQYTKKVEMVALDEAYLDVSTEKDPVRLAQQIQQKVWQKLQLTCSAGVSYNKYLAKLASDYQKPCGLTLVRPEETKNFISCLSLSAFGGVGKKTYEQLQKLGIHNGADLYACSEQFLCDHLGKAGFDLYRNVHGLDEREVAYQKERQSLGTERSFHPPIFEEEKIVEQFSLFAQRLSQKLQEKDLFAVSVSIKWRCQGKNTHTKQKKLRQPTQEAYVLVNELNRLWWEEESILGLSLLGISVGVQKTAPNQQLCLF